MFLLLPTTARAQGNYEIQVYGADTVEPKNLMVELHSNFTPEGQKNTIDGVYPTNHQEHETIELPDTWTWELRPIVDKTVGRWYFAVNPALERTWHGPDVAQGLGFAPGAKIGFDINKQVNVGFEYYADYGRLGDFDKLHEQQQQIFAVTDLNVSPKWEINIGVGVGPTAATDHLIVKGILGRRFDWGHHSATE